MRTLDGAEVAKNAVDRLYSKFPAGSLSAREVVMTIPMDFDEERIQRINAAITQSLYQKADDFIKSLPPKTKPGFSILPKDISYVDRRAEEEERKRRITQGVVDAVHSVK